jgi:uncharacterized protein
MDRPELTVAVVYATPGIEDITELALPLGSTVDEAIERSAVLRRHPQLADGPLELGVWERTVAGGHVLSDGDRVEIYRPLMVDPKEARRVRAAVRRRRRAG